MNKTIILWILFCNVSSVFCQIKDNLPDYYKNVINAEQAIVENKFEKASDFYQEAFLKKQYPFCIDIKNAIIAELYSRKNKELLNKWVYTFFTLSKLEVNEVFCENKSDYYYLPSELKQILDWQNLSLKIKLIFQQGILKINFPLKSSFRVY